MADTKISAMTNGGAVQATDNIPAVRAGANVRVQVPGPVTPAGSNLQVQFNDSGAFGGDAGLTYDKSTGILSTYKITFPGLGTWSINGTYLQFSGALLLVDTYVAYGTNHAFGRNNFSEDGLFFGTGTTAYLGWTHANYYSIADTVIQSPTAAEIRFGKADIAAPVAQKLSVQNVLTGTTDTAGADFIIAGSQGTGTGAGGKVKIQVATAGLTGSAKNALADALTVNSDKSVTVAGALSSGAVSINDATTPSLTTAAGKTNTGYVLINGKTSGSFKLTTADATAQAVVLSLAAQTVGGATLTLPDMAGSNDTVALLAKSQALTNKTLNGNTFTAGTYTLTGSAGKTLNFLHTLTLDGTDGVTIIFPATNDTVAGLATTQTFTGINTYTPAARSSGVASYLTVNAPADTNQTLSTESIGFSLVGSTRQWATGALATQRERVFAAPTIAFVGGSTVTDFINTDFSDPAIGTNATVTNLWSLQAGRVKFAPTARTVTSIQPYFRIITPADTNLTASTEAPGVILNTGTRTWATTGTVALQREVFLAGPTYASAGASQTFTDVCTLYISPPVVGTNAIFTRNHSLVIVDATAAASSITGGLIIATALGTAATSVGIGNGAINAGGLITGGTITSTGAFTASSTSTHTGAATFNSTISVTGTNATTAFTVTQTARTSGVLPYIKYTIPTDTAQTASTESPGIQGVTGTRTWATTGTVALQREIFFPGPTYASASASQTFTEVFNLYLTPPVQGTNAIFTRAHTLGILDATSSSSSITGGFVIATTLGTAATSIGMGGGNITAGGNIFASTSTGRIGYLAGSGVGSTVTQGTNRTTGVTINTPTGQITLFSAAGSATATTFTVTCSSVAATDVIVMDQVSGTNLYVLAVTAVGAGSFNVTFFTTGGTATDAPVFNYAVIKGSAT